MQILTPELLKGRVLCWGLKIQEIWLACQVHRGSLVPTSTTVLCLGKVEFDQNEAKNTGETITHIKQYVVSVIYQ